ncbi:MAG: 2-amino-4-hydroxy-6-hydroxymethyldihydropteridine diphosphokinase [Cellvibrionaceae bacterium]|nr:2-amino-4-hydroxy-6-hydroxymethyldihydropteridine diphosphokinase [Cellvibrionaceae bacterium]
MKAKASVFIGLGSNLNDPRRQLERAIVQLQQLPESSGLACSPHYQSRALGPGDQPDYINAVVQLNTALTPRALLHELQKIENRQGRQRTIRWGARTLDLDMLLYNAETLNGDDLQLPHPELEYRNFVLLPLYDLAPALRLPNGKSLAHLVAHCDRQGIHKLIESP